MSDVELKASELGTKEYWDSAYENEIENFKDHGDVGEVWFGETISRRIVNWIDRNVAKTSSILDVGCGNGMLLNELAALKFQHLTGVDYSQNAITLGRSIANEQKQAIQFLVVDILDYSLEMDKYDIIIDKGTYDAICLSKDTTVKRKQYLENVCKSLQSDGKFILTSCNWTLAEVENHFNEKLKRCDLIPTPQMQFGGKIGNVVTSVVFQRKQI